MSYVPVDELMKNIDSVFKLAILSARRASELSNGMPRLVEVESKKPAIIALQEIAQGKISYKISKK